MKYTIRKAKTDRHMEQIFALDLLCFASEEGALGSIEDLTGSDWWIAWDESGDPVGYGGVVIYEDFAIHKRCGVLPCARKQGLQKKMLKVRETYAKKQGCEVICTYVSVENPISANNLIKVGYRAYVPEWQWGGREFLYVQKALVKNSRSEEPAKILHELL